MEGRLNIRLAILILLVLALLTTAGGQLFSLQNGRPALSATGAAPVEKTSIEYQTIPAARGEILDRCGRPLVANRLGMNLTLDETRLLRADDPAKEVFRLLDAAERHGVILRDILPITAPPYEYHFATEETRAHFDAFLIKKGYDPMDADALMAQLREDYGIPEDVPSVRARKAAGIFYELELRRLFTRVAPYRYIAPYVFAEDVPMGLVSIVREQNLAGCVLEPVSTRVYETEFAAHLLGRVGQIPAEMVDHYTGELGYRREDIVGVDGAEKAFESWLRGKPGLRAVEQAPSGRIHNVYYSTEPEPGKNVYLTIDIRFQQRVEELLRDGILEMQRTGEELKGAEADAGAIAVVDVRSGEVLALANYPTYNLATFRADYADLLADPQKPLLNRSISGLYSPGSTFKMVTATAGLETGKIGVNTKIFDRGKFTEYKDTQPTCLIYPGSHGAVNVSESLKVSCNYFYYDISYKMGIAPIKEWAERYGLGRLTGIELDGERAGFIASPETSAALGITWQRGLTLVAAIGQSDNLFTPLQMANYTAAIANGGAVNRVHLMREAKNHDFTQTYAVDHGGVLHEVGASDATMRALQQGMLAVSTQQGGSAYNVFGDYPVPVAAKTGSVQTGTDRPINGVFVAYAPYHDPEIAVCVVIEKGGAGFRAAPFAREVFDAWYALREEREQRGEENHLQK